MQDGEVRVPIALRLDDQYRRDPDAVRSILVAADERTVPLGRLATVATVEAPSTITREWGKRRIVVQSNVRGRDVGSFVAETQQAIAEKVTLPPATLSATGASLSTSSRHGNAS